MHCNTQSLCHTWWWMTVLLSMFCLLASNSDWQIVCRKFDTHGEKYLAICKKLKIDPNHTCIPAMKEKDTQQDKENKDSGQHNLGFVTSTPQWTKERLLKHIIEFVVKDDQVCDLDSFEESYWFSSSLSRLSRRNLFVSFSNISVQQQRTMIYPTKQKSTKR